jgi:hypothetical protein
VLIVSKQPCIGIEVVKRRLRQNVPSAELQHWWTTDTLDMYANLLFKQSCLRIFERVAHALLSTSVKQLFLKSLPE